jgi:hypothetical protein
MWYRILNAWSFAFVSIFLIRILALRFMKRKLHSFWVYFEAYFILLRYYCATEPFPCYQRDISLVNTGPSGLLLGFAWCWKYLWGDVSRHVSAAKYLWIYGFSSNTNYGMRRQYPDAFFNWPVKAQWLLYVLPTLTLQNSAFFPHGIFVDLVRFSEWKVISLNRINRLVFVMKMRYVFLWTGNGIFKHY